MSMLVRLKEWLEKRARMVERLPGWECDWRVNVRRDLDLDLDFCLGFSGFGVVVSKVVVVVVGAGSGDGMWLLSLYRTRNRVVFPPSSSMSEARMVRLKVCAARTLAIAAVVGCWEEWDADDDVEGEGEGEDKRCMAAAEVEEVSIRSVWERYFER